MIRQAYSFSSETAEEMRQVKQLPTVQVYFDFPHRGIRTWRKTDEETRRCCDVDYASTALVATPPPYCQRAPVIPSKTASIKNRTTRKLHVESAIMILAVVVSGKSMTSFYGEDMHLTTGRPCSQFKSPLAALIDWVLHSATEAC